MASNQVPLNFTIPVLPPGDYTMQQLVAFLSENLTASTTNDVALFRSGPTEPTSNVGLWFNTNINEWFRWDEDTGVYVRASISQVRLRYILQQDDGNNANDPDPDDYLVWFVVDGTGAGVDIRTHNGTDWVGIYYTKAQVDATVANVLEMHGAFVQPNVNQEITPDGAYNTVAFGREFFDRGNIFASNSWVVDRAGLWEIQGMLVLQNNAGTPATASAMFIEVGAAINGAVTTVRAGNSTPSPNNDKWFISYPSVYFELATGDIITVRLSAADGVGTGKVNILADSGGFSCRFFSV